MGGHRHGDRHADRHADRAEAIRARSERVAERMEARHQRRADAIAAARGRKKARASRWSADETARRASAQVARAANNRVVGSVLIAIGANWLLMELGLFPFGFAGLVALGLAVLGLGLMGTAKAGPPGKLLFTGIVMTAILAMSGGVVAQVQGPFAGDRLVAVTSADELRDEYSLGVGDLTIDLTEVEFTEVPETIKATVQVGDLTVRVPEDVSVRAVGHVRGVGSIRLLERSSEGAGNLKLSHEDSSFDSADERVILDLGASVGDIVVERVR